MKSEFILWHNALGCFGMAIAAAIGLRAWGNEAVVPGVSAGKVAGTVVE